MVAPLPATAGSLTQFVRDLNNPQPQAPSALMDFTRSLDPMPRSDALPPEARALLEVIAGTESAGKYNVIYGGGRFDDYSAHPDQYVRITSGPNKGDVSSAAGKYQFLGSTWDKAQKALDLPDFSPASQDKAAWWLAEQRYQRETGRNLLADLQAGGDANMKRIAGSLRNEWTSLPGGIEQGQNQSRFARTYNSVLSNQLGRPVPPNGIPVAAPKPTNMNALTSFKRGLDTPQVRAPVPRPRVEMEVAKNNASPILRQLPQVLPSARGGQPSGELGSGASSRDLNIFRAGYAGGSPTSNAEGVMPSMRALDMFRTGTGAFKPSAPAPRTATSAPGAGVSQSMMQAMRAVPAAPRAPAPSYGVGGANQAGTTQLPRNVVPAAATAGLRVANAGVAAIPPAPRPLSAPTLSNQAMMQAMRATPAELAKPVAPRVAAPIPATRPMSAPKPATMSAGLANQRANTQRVVHEGGYAYAIDPVRGKVLLGGNGPAAAPRPATMSPGLAASRTAPRPMMAAPMPAPIAQRPSAAQTYLAATAPKPATMSPGMQQLYRAGNYTYEKTPNGYVKVGSTARPSTSGGGGSDGGGGGSWFDIVSNGGTYAT